MMKKELLTYDQLGQAEVDGRWEEIAQLYDHNIAFLGVGRSDAAYSSRMVRAMLAAGQKDSPQLQKCMLTRTLVFEYMLIHRCETQLMALLKESDRRVSGGPEWGAIPPEIAETYLPRLGKLYAELQTTIKSISALNRNQAAPEKPDEAS